MFHHPGNDVHLGNVVNSGTPLMLSRDDRARHTYIVGASRTGKTKLVENICRQDLLGWRHHHCPIVVIDPHDTLYDGLMAYAAAEGLNGWPIIPFDLRRDDLIVSYDLLRKRTGISPAVTCQAFVEAILHAWGQTNTQDTPRLASILASILMVAYEKDCTLSEALQLLYDPSLRKVLTADLESIVARTTLLSAQAAGEKSFQERVESTMHRINAFLMNSLLEATLCTRTGQSLDLGAVLEQGKILLCCLSTRGAKISQTDAAAVGSLLLTDLWTAAKRRGKAEEGRRIPCYVHIDEFQNFLTPDIAIGLTEASGFGLHLTMAHQYPSQLPDRHEKLGDMILNAVLATAKNKIVFQLEHPKDLDMLAAVMGRQMIDLDKVKQEIWSTRVLGYNLAWLPAFSQSTSEGLTRTQAWGESHVTGQTTARNWNDVESISRSLNATVSEGESQSEGVADALGVTKSETRAVGRSTERSASEANTTSNQQGTQQTTAAAHATGLSETRGTKRDEARTFRPLSSAFAKELERYNRGELTPKEVAEFQEKYATQYSLTEGISQQQARTSTDSVSLAVGCNAAQGIAHSSTSGRSEGVTQSETSSLGRNETLTHSQSLQQSNVRSAGTASATSLSHGEGGSETESEQFGTSRQESEARSEQQTYGLALHPTLLPVLGKELSSRQTEPREDQLFRLTQFLDAQPDRHCLVRTASTRIPVAIHTIPVEPPLADDNYRDRYTTRRIKALPFVLEAQAAAEQIRKRKSALRERFVAAKSMEEPATARRRVGPATSVTPPGGDSANT